MCPTLYNRQDRLDRLRSAGHACPAIRSLSISNVTVKEEEEEGNWLQGLDAFPHLTELHLEFSDPQDLYDALKYCCGALRSLSVCIPRRTEDSSSPSCSDLFELIATRFETLETLGVYNGKFLDTSSSSADEAPWPGADKNSNRLHHHVLYQLRAGRFQQLRKICLPKGWTPVLVVAEVELMSSMVNSNARYVQSLVLSDLAHVWREIKCHVPDIVGWNRKLRNRSSSLWDSQRRPGVVSLVASFNTKSQLMMGTDIDAGEDEDCRSSVLDLQVHIGMHETPDSATILEDYLEHPPKKDDGEMESALVYIHVVACVASWSRCLSHATKEAGRSLKVIYNLPLLLEDVRARGWSDAVFQHLQTDPFVSLTAAVAIGAISVGFFHSLCGILHGRHESAQHSEQGIMLRHPQDRNTCFMIDVGQFCPEKGEQPQPSVWPAWVISELKQKETTSKPSYIVFC